MQAQPRPRLSACLGSCALGVRRKRATGTNMPHACRPARVLAGARQDQPPCAAPPAFSHTLSHLPRSSPQQLGVQPRLCACAAAREALRRAAAAAPERKLQRGAARACERRRLRAAALGTRRYTAAARTACRGKACERVWTRQHTLPCAEPPVSPRSCAHQRRAVRRTAVVYSRSPSRRVNLARARCPERRVHLRVSHCYRQPACQGRRAAMSSKVSARLSCARLCAAAAHSSPRNARALAFRCGCCTRVRTLVRWPLPFAGVCALTLVLRSSTGEGHIVTVRDAGCRAFGPHH